MFKVVSPSRGLGILQLGALIGGFALISSILRWEEGTAARLIIYLSILILGVLLGSAWRGANEGFERRNFSIGNGQVTYNSAGPKLFWTWIALNTLRLSAVLLLLPGTVYLIRLITPYIPVGNTYLIVTAVVIYWGILTSLILWLFPKYDKWRGEKERAIDPVAWEATQPKSGI